MTSLVQTPTRPVAVTDIPIVSVIILTYNSEHYIERCLRSLQRQTFHGFEALIVDAGSNDQTQAIVAQFDARFKWLELPRSDMGAARNHGMRMSKGEYICFLDSDDFYLQQKIERQLNELREHPEVDVVYCSAWHFRTGAPNLVGLKKLSAQPEALKDYLEGRNHNLNTMFMRRTVLDAGFCFGEGDRGRYGEEWRMQLSMAQHGVPMVFIPDPLVVVEVRPDSHTSWSRQWMMKIQAIGEIERVASLLTPAQRAIVDVASILDKFRSKLMVALLLEGRKREAGQAAASITNVHLARKAKLLVLLCSIIPTALLGSMLQFVWLARQNRSFDWNASSPGLRAEFSAVQPIPALSVDR